MTKLIIKHTEDYPYEFINANQLDIDRYHNGFPHLMVLIHYYEGNSPNIYIEGEIVDSDTEEYKTVMFELTLLGYI